jgi:hypothetical protein
MLEFMLAVIIAFMSMAFTIFCGIKYIHPGSHRGYRDWIYVVPWRDAIKQKWWDFKDVPVPVHGLVAHVIRCWWWLATGLNLKEWASVHRHNHLNADKKWANGRPETRIGRAKLYPGQASNTALVNAYGIETPNTWIDRNLYYRLPMLGPVVYLSVLYSMLGILGLIPWLAQMSWFWFWRSESVNGYYLQDFEWNRLFHVLKKEDYYS